MKMPFKRLKINEKGRRVNNSRASKSSAGRRRPQNRYLLEGDIAGVSASSKKLRLTEKSHVNVDPSFGYRLIEFITVFTALAELVVCKNCGSNVRFKETSIRGLGFKIAVCCQTCEPQYIDSSPKTAGYAFEINRRIIFCFRLLGVGYNGLLKFCAFMCLPSPVVKSAYYKIVDAMVIASTAVRDSSMKKAAAQEKDLSQGEQGSSGLTVSGDGTWKKRGFSSLLGVTSLIGWKTGKVIDLEVKSKMCKACDLWKDKEETAAFDEWYTTHESICQRNHDGSSGKMEVDAVVQMFQRSIDLHGVNYGQYIGDGDSKTFKGIIEANLYEDSIVKKKECIDHIQKRMGSRLRQLVKKTKGLSGKEKLTGKLIDELSIYYGLAIRRNSKSVENMKREIWATLYHKTSTDTVPQHINCPEGADSWCTWQKAKADGQLEDYIHKPPMKREVFDAIRPIYEELSRDDLLERCLGGFTQNANESFNACIWSISPKTIHSGKNIVDIAASVATCTFNDGLSSIMDIMNQLQLEIGPSCYNFCTKADKERIERAELRTTEAAKEARRLSMAVKKMDDALHVNLEGMLYGPGIAD